MRKTIGQGLPFYIDNSKGYLFMETRTRSHILLIDDNPAELKPLVALLRASHMHVSIVDCPRQGYRRALALAPDLLVLDLHMPGMDGFAVCRLLREAPNMRHIPIIFLSAANALQDRLTGLQLGGVDFVTKPYAAEEVLARIGIHLRLSQYQSGTVPSVQPEQTSTDEDELLLKAAIRLIMDNLATPPTVAELIVTLGTYEKRLLQIFRERLNMTVSAFVREARLTKAKELLAEHQLAIEDIAYLVGFSSAANFATAFKHREGVTPRDFRTRYRQ